MQLFHSCTNACSKGYTVLEVIIAIFIFGCITSAIFRLIGQTDRIHGRAVFVENGTRLALNEAERLRVIAACNSSLEDSSYTETVSSRSFKVERDVIETDSAPSFLPQPRKPFTIELRISDENNGTIAPLRFKLLLGQDNP